MAWIDIAADYNFTERAIKEFKNGMILRFNYEGSIIEMKIMRIAWPKVWVKQITTLSVQEFEKEMDKRREEDKKKEKSSKKLIKK